MLLVFLLLFFLYCKAFQALKNKHTLNSDWLAAVPWHLFLLAAGIMTSLLLVPYTVFLLIIYLCVCVCVSVVSSGLQSSKGSVFPVTVLWQKHLHTVTRSDQPKQLSPGKSYRENVYAPPEHISQTPATWIKLAATHKSLLFFFSRLIQFFLISICMALSRVLSSVIVMRDADL